MVTEPVGLQNLLHVLWLCIGCFCLFTALLGTDTSNDIPQMRDQGKPDSITSHTELLHFLWRSNLALPYDTGMIRFDGLTVLHKFTLEAGSVTYQNRHLNPDQEDHIKKHADFSGVTFGQDPCGTLFSRTVSTFVRAGKVAWEACIPKDMPGVCVAVDYFAPIHSPLEYPPAERPFE